MQQYEKVTPEDVRQLSDFCPTFLCPKSANIYGIYFQEFKIRDVDTGKTLFHVQRDPETAKAEILDESDDSRQVSYQFRPDFFEMKTIGTTLVFGTGILPFKNLLMIERHYFLNELIKSFEFTFPYCIPNTTNTWEAIYELPPLSEEMMLQMMLNPNATKSDSFYFVEGELVMHTKAEFDYATLFAQEEYQKQLGKDDNKLYQK